MIKEAPKSMVGRELLSLHFLRSAHVITDADLKSCTKMPSVLKSPKALCEGLPLYKLLPWLGTRHLVAITLLNSDHQPKEQRHGRRFEQLA